MTGRSWKRLAGAGTAAVFVACGVAAPQALAAEPAAEVASAAPAAAEVDYDTWMRDVQAVIDEARPWVEERSADAGTEKQALVFDIDNTTLETDLNFAVPQNAVRPSLELARYADSRGVDIFFVTARPMVLDPVSRINLELVGYEVDGLYVRHLPDFFKDTGEYKEAKRADIEAQGYNIIANIGNTPTDLQGGHAEKHFKLPDYDGQLS